MTRTGEPGELAVGYAGEHYVKGTRIMVYALGQWCALLLLLCCVCVQLAAEEVTHGLHCWSLTKGDSYAFGGLGIREGT